MSIGGTVQKARAAIKTFNLVLFKSQDIWYNEMILPQKAKNIARVLIDL